MSDNDVIGYFRILLRLCNSEPWRDVWHDLRCPVRTFDDFGLAATANDAEIWRVCQRERLVLVTGNRNAVGPNSLEAMVANYNDSGCLPVLTFADVDRFASDRLYAESVVERFLETLIDLDSLRGAGRLYLP